MVWVAIAVVFRVVSFGRCLGHQVAVARIVKESRADDVRDWLDRPHQQQDSGQHPQQPMRSSSRASCCRPFHRRLSKHTDANHYSEPLLWPTEGSMPMEGSDNHWNARLHQSGRSAVALAVESGSAGSRWSRLSVRNVMI
jgi:hypothetical protein